MTTERESIRKLLDSHSPVADWLRDGVASGRIRSSDDVDLDEEIVVVGGDSHEDVDGSKQAKCGVCGSVVWLAPSTQEMMAKRAPASVTIACVRCLLRHAKAELKEMPDG
jgi:hypothetical protein